MTEFTWIAAVPGSFNASAVTADGRSTSRSVSQAAAAATAQMSAAALAFL
jgi:hypothetical protein